MTRFSVFETSFSGWKISFGRYFILTLIPFALSGCGMFNMNIDTMHNQISDSKETITRASENITINDLSDGIFVGIALSGGGSRAANFSSAILLELKKLGILDKATAISSVSGSSLPAAYYGLYPERWNDVNDIRKQMAKDYEIRWIGRWLLPQNILLYWNTNFNRSDIMKEVLDSNLYDGKTFADLGKGQPRILINSTTLSGGKTFVFSKEQFDELNSRIDTYPVSNAVMASSAFPGAFHDMTLYDFSISDNKHYKHVLDGGPSDNLGITTLLNIVKPLYDAPEPKQPKGCFLFVVDSNPYPKYPKHIHEADTRSPIDFIFDTNVAAASDSLLTVRRLDLLYRLNIDARTPDIEPFKRNNTENEKVELDNGKEIECAVWHLSLQRLLAHDFASRKIEDDDNLKGKLRENVDQVASVVNSIPTRYKLTGRDPNGNIELNADTLQDYLFKAADYLVNDDNDNGGLIRDQVCAWFKQKGMQGTLCDTETK
ncbi:MAG: patatin-like phospholipase family protein [Desulfuromonadaceae bacterium]